MKRSTVQSKPTRRELRASAHAQRMAVAAMSRPKPPEPPKPAIERFAAPHDVDNITAVMGGGREVFALMPRMEEIPPEFRARDGYWQAIQRQWFFSGLDARIFHQRLGIDRRKALAHLSAIQRSFEPSHEHKMAAVSWLLSLWFEGPKT